MTHIRYRFTEHAHLWSADQSRRLAIGVFTYIPGEEVKPSIPGLSEVQADYLTRDEVAAEFMRRLDEISQVAQAAAGAASR